jgi:hypothetical protein
MKLKDYFLKAGLFYRQVAERSKPTMHESQAYYVIQKPGRVSLATFLSVARVLGMPEDEATDEWAETKAREVKKRIVSDVASGRSRNYSVYKNKK